MSDHPLFTFSPIPLMDTVIAVHNLRKVYPGKKPFVAIDDISFELKQGEILGLLGPNGSGKTTTIQMLLGTLASTSGSIFYFGKDFSANRPQILQHVSFASTYTSLPWILTVKENLEVFGCLYGMTRKESMNKFDPLLERFGILDKRNNRVSSLSAGQITRLMLVKAFFVQPKVVLLDEPTASLDPDISNDICSFLLEERDKSQLSMLFSSHKMDEVMELCDRAIFLKEGKIIADDVPDKLAKTFSGFRVRLVIVDGLKRTMALAHRQNLAVDLQHRTLEITIEEDKIPEFLNALSELKVTYTSIKIEEPSLEDYFLKIAKKSS